MNGKVYDYHTIESWEIFYLLSLRSFLYNQPADIPIPKYSTAALTLKNDPSQPGEIGTIAVKGQMDISVSDTQSLRIKTCWL